MNGPGWATSEMFEDGDALFTAVCEHGLEASSRSGSTRAMAPRWRGWIKTKNPNY